MDTLKEKLNSLIANRWQGKNSEDICEHLHTLYEYAKTCDSVFETGVRGCVSSWAFLCGLVDGSTTGSGTGTKKLFMNDISVCNVGELVELSKNFDVDVTYEWKNNLELNLTDTYDITFIDTWHVYGQLKRELDKFSKVTNKYIIMHDTTVDEIYGETIRVGWDAQRQSRETGIPLDEINKGLWPAIEEFVNANEEWFIKERFTHNNGLTILAKKQ